MAKPFRLLDAVRDVLLREWDPIGVAHNSVYSDEHDRYAITVCRYLTEGVDATRLAAYLAQVQAVSMGLSRIDEERDKLVVRRLFSLEESHPSVIPAARPVL